MLTGTEYLGLNMSIVFQLQKYGAIPLRFLAKIIGRQTDEIDTVLKNLQKKGIVEISGDIVSLVDNQGAPTRA